MHRDHPPGDTPPEVNAEERSFVLPGKRAPGLFLLALLPVLAVSGLTSMRGEAASVEEGLVLSVEYPRVIRYLKQATMRLAISNPGEEAADAVEVTLGGDYVRAYSELALIPDASRISPEGLIIELDSVPAGETRFIRVQLRASEYWWHAGEISAAAGDVHVSVGIGTLVLP